MIQNLSNALLAVFYLTANYRDWLSSTLSVGCNSNVLFLHHRDAILNSILYLKMYSMLKNQSLIYAIFKYMFFGGLSKMTITDFHENNFSLTLSSNIT